MWNQLKILWGYIHSCLNLSVDNNALYDASRVMVDVTQLTDNALHGDFNQSLSNASQLVVDTGSLINDIIHHHQ